MITIKKIKLNFEFIDGTPKDFPVDLIFEGKESGDLLTPKFTFEGKNSYIHKADGFHISLNKLGEAFKNGDDWRFQEKLFIPHTSIKMVREQIEYHLENREVLILIGRYSNPEKPITFDVIKKKLEANGVKFSSEGLKKAIGELKLKSKILKPQLKIEAWITKEAENRSQAIVFEEVQEELRELEARERKL